MNDEIPIANPPLSPEEQSVVAKLSDADLHVIDNTILANCARHWYKVARVVSMTEETLRPRYAGLSFIFYAQRLTQLADEGRLDSQGDISFMRFSEVRLPPGGK
jgi:hypothetical protein